MPPSGSHVRSDICLPVAKSDLRTEIDDPAASEKYYTTRNRRMLSGWRSQFDQRWVTCVKYGRGQKIQAWTERQLEDQKWGKRSPQRRPTLLSLSKRRQVECWNAVCVTDSCPLGHCCGRGLFPRWAYRSVRSELRTGERTGLVRNSTQPVFFFFLSSLFFFSIRTF